MSLFEILMTASTIAYGAGCVWLNGERLHWKERATAAERKAGV